jgi:hypothetical protein
MEHDKGIELSWGRGLGFRVQISGFDEAMWLSRYFIVVRASNQIL